MTGPRGDELETLAHDLKTYLATVQGYAQLIQQGRLRDEAALQQAASSIERAVRTMNMLLDQRVTAARTERHGFRLGTLAPVGIEPLVAELTRDFAGLLLQEQLELRLDLPPHLPMLKVDPLALRRSLANLLTNAVSFSAGRGGGGHIELAARAEDQGVALYLTDCGPGLDPEALDKLFQPHTSGRKHTYQEGQGLGLYIAHGFITAHGGSITVDASYPGPGARFRVWLPAG